MKYIKCLYFTVIIDATLSRLIKRRNSGNYLKYKRLLRSEALIEAFKHDRDC